MSNIQTPQRRALEVLRPTPDQPFILTSRQRYFLRRYCLIKTEIFFWGISIGVGTCSDLWGINIAVFGHNPPGQNPLGDNPDQTSSCHFSTLVRRATKYEKRIEFRDEFCPGVSILVAVGLELVTVATDSVLFKLSGKKKPYVSIC